MTAAEAPSAVRALPVVSGPRELRCNPFHLPELLSPTLLVNFLLPHFVTLVDFDDLAAMVVQAAPDSAQLCDDAADALTLCNIELRQDIVGRQSAEYEENALRWWQVDVANTMRQVKERRQARWTRIYALHCARELYIEKQLPKYGNSRDAVLRNIPGFARCRTAVACSSVWLGAVPLLWSVSIDLAKPKVLLPIYDTETPHKHRSALGCLSSIAASQRLSSLIGTSSWADAFFGSQASVFAPYSFADDAESELRQLLEQEAATAESSAAQRRAGGTAHEGELGDYVEGERTIVSGDELDADFVFPKEDEDRWPMLGPPPPYEA
ncbi:hypothetical protein JCM10213_007658 [Rhodosporidiobolus nylandii]